MINYEGKELVTFPKINEGDVEEPTTNKEDNYVSVFYNNKNYASLKKSDSEYIIYDLDNRKEILKLDAFPDMSNNYIQVSANGKKQYYLYSGKMFYEE